MIHFDLLPISDANIQMDPSVVIPANTMIHFDLLPISDANIQMDPSVRWDEEQKPTAHAVPLISACSSCSDHTGPVPR